MANKLQQLKKMTTVVADTGDIEAIKQWQPEDATTNPSLLLKAAEMDMYQGLLKDSINYGQKEYRGATEQVLAAADYFSVLIGKEILQVIPGRISTEVDARLSFDTDAMIHKAKFLIDLYANHGIDKQRVLIKLASTWEGIKAAEVLEKEDINCNLTLMFSFSQAVAAAQAGAYLISPFVGRILDWYKASTGRDHYPPHQDPGVISVSRIYDHYKACGYNTIVMGASFRNVGEIEELAGCDRLTISPDLLKALSEDEGELERKLSPSESVESIVDTMTESHFRWQLNEDAMATEKLADGIRRFAIDQIKLESKLKELAN